MSKFAYVARNLTGDRVVGSIEASSERDVLNMLGGQSLFPLDVSEEKPAANNLFSRRVKGQLMAVLYSQLSSLLRSGVPLLRSIRILHDQASQVTLKTVLGEIHDRVEDGEPLGEAMARHPRVFSEMAVNMVRAGGEGGFLEDALERVSSFTEEQEDLKSRTTGALAYPIFLAVVGTTVVTVLIVFFVPKFSMMFDTLRDQGELPVMTDWLLAFSELVRGYGLFLVAAIFLVLLVIRARLQSERGRYTRDQLKLRLPLLGVIFKNLAVARFCRVLGTLLRNGVPILKSLAISRQAAGNRVLSEAIDRATDNITGGESLAKPLAASGHFPRTVVEMIAVAEESNTLDTVLVEVADGLEKRTSRSLDLAVRLLEPIMLLVLAGIVLFVVMALLMPVIKMSSMFG
ncbi:MAG: type II secretion system F family protein [Pirellulaceae bacterium]|nr:type II secretion system F family protein [Pirellulaceae bacterium]